MNEGLTIAPGVIETILSLSVAQVDGIAQVGSSRLSRGFISALGKKHPAQGIILLADDDGGITVAVHVQIFYGYRLQEVAEKVRHAVLDTLSGQIGVEVQSVDVYVDGIQFPE
jgi:uncharacterized alkaline shock family protein YloU